VRVDKSRHERKPMRIDGRLSLRQVAAAKHADFAGLKTDAARKRGSAGAVIDRTIFD